MNESCAKLMLFLLSSVKFVQNNLSVDGASNELVGWYPVRCFFVTLGIKTCWVGSQTSSQNQTNEGEACIQGMLNSEKSYFWNDIFLVTWVKLFIYYLSMFWIPRPLFPGNPGLECCTIHGNIQFNQS